MPEQPQQPGSPLPPAVSAEELQKLLLAQKSFVGPAVVTFLLYFLCWLPGFIANLAWAFEAEAVRKRTGIAPPGYSGLKILALLGVFPMCLFSWVIGVPVAANLYEPVFLSNQRPPARSDAAPPAPTATPVPTPTPLPSARALRTKVPFSPSRGEFIPQQFQKLRVTAPDGIAGVIGFASVPPGQPGHREYQLIRIDAGSEIHVTGEPRLSDGKWWYPVGLYAGPGTEASGWVPQESITRDRVVQLSG